MRDELMGLLRGMEREGHQQDRAFYLEAWNGTGRFTFDRIGRGTTDIENVCLSVLGSIQPGPLNAYLKDTVGGGAGDDGLLQRFQLLVWPDPSPKWQNIDRWPDHDASKAADEVFERLAKIDPVKVEAQQDEPGRRWFLRFSDEAQEAFDEWRADLERRLRSGKMHPAMEAHLAKYRSLVPSLALICHLADRGVGSVGLVPLTRALAWAAYLETHALRLYDGVLRTGLTAARAFGEKISTGVLQDGFTVRDVYRHEWSGLTEPTAVHAAAEVLEDLDWLRPEVVMDGGRPKKTFRINPHLKQATAS